MNPIAGQALISGGQSAGNLISDLIFNKQRKQEQEQAYQRQIDFWNKQNEYNSPAAQMARYKEAGLNPNLIYGGGSASAGNTATSSPKYDPPQMNAPKLDMNFNVMNMLQMAQDLKNKAAQNDLIQEQTKAIEQKRLNDGIWNSILATRNLSDQLGYQFKSSAFDYNLEALKNKNLMSAQTLENLKTMNEKLGQDIKQSESITALNWDRHKYAKEGLNLRTPGGLEQVLEKFFSGMGTSSSKILFNAGNMSRQWHPNGFYNPFVPFQMFKDLFK